MTYVLLVVTFINGAVFYGAVPEGKALCELYKIKAEETHKERKDVSSIRCVEAQETLTDKK